MNARYAQRAGWIALVAAVTGCYSGPPPAVAPELDPEAAAVASARAHIDPAGLLAHVSFLASDDLAGRDTPSPGLEAAAEYIARRFEGLGLEPGGEDGGWLQRFPFVRTSLDAEASRLSAQGEGGGASLAFGEEWFALPVLVGSETATGELHYAGSLGAGAYSEDVSGKVVAVTVGPELGMALFQEIGLAVESGAAGLLLVLDPAVPAEAVPTIVSEVSGLPPQPIPVVGVVRSAASQLLALGGADIDAVLPPVGAAGPAAAPGGSAVEVQIAVGMVREESLQPNVVGVLRGSDPTLRDDYVVYSAHFDHVGVGAPDASGDSIYNGADDNASGTAMIMEVAQAFAALPEAPRRSVVFLAVSGEEKGLLGALHWADQPTLPIDRVVANINTDMVGRNAPDTVIAIGAEFTTLGELSREVAADHPDLGLAIGPDPDPSQNLFVRSDHVAFVQKQIPAIAFTTGLHEDYHAPSDEVEDIDFDKLTRLSRLTFLIGWEVAQGSEPPTWLPGAWEQVEEMLKFLPF